MSNEKILTELKKHNMSEIETLENIRSKDGVHVYRFMNNKTCYVIKYFEKREYKREISHYKLLQKLNIPTIPVISMIEDSIILEDIEKSETYRLGKASDLEHIDVAKGLVKWYRLLHQQGELYLKTHPELLNALYNEYEELSKDDIKMIMNRSNSSEYMYWKLMLNNFDQIRSLIRQYTSTLTYNDFYWTNFIVSKDERDVIMFDYNFLGCGFKYSDVRNISVSLKGEAKNVFLELYDDYEEAERILDEVLSELFSLKSAYSREQFPSWAEELREHIHNGELETKVNRLVSYFKLEQISN